MGAVGAAVGLEGGGGLGEGGYVTGRPPPVWMMTYYRRRSRCRSTPGCREAVSGEASSTSFSGEASGKSERVGSDTRSLPIRVTKDLVENHIPVCPSRRGPGRVRERRPHVRAARSATLHRARRRQPRPSLIATVSPGGGGAAEEGFRAESWESTPGRRGRHDSQPTPKHQPALPKAPGAWTPGQASEDRIGRRRVRPEQIDWCRDERRRRHGAEEAGVPLASSSFLAAD